MIKTDIRLPVGYKSEDIIDAVCSALPIKPCEIGEIDILKKALRFVDSIPEYALSVGIGLSPERESGLLKMRKTVSPYKKPLIFLF